MSSSEFDQPSPTLNWAFDEQLELGGSLFDFLPPNRSVRKRDGREEAFDGNKVMRSIARAAADVQLDDTDLARGIAAGVTLYLAGMETEDSFETVEVHGAVERALIEMGYSNVASAFVRHRERRDRLYELSRDLDREDFDRARQTDGLKGDAAILVLNGDDTVSPWNQSRIVSALMRETGLGSAQAETVAADVERRVRALGFRTMTVGLIRELVGASLLETVDSSERSKHQRLGIPLFDAEQTICGRDELLENTFSNDPDATDRILAGRVKREFALSRVFSQEVGEAHRWGDLFINDLDSIDRLVSISASPDFVKLNGMPGPRQQGSLRARRADTLVAQLAGASVAFGRCLTGGFTWTAVNWHLAPYLTDLDSEQIRDVARVLLFEFAYRRMVDPQGTDGVQLGVCWAMPESLRHAPPIGPRGEVTADSYADYHATARRFAWALVELHREGSGDKPELLLPRLIVNIGPDCFLEEGFGNFLLHLCESAPTGNITTRFLRESLLFAPENDPMRPQEVVAHDITLNLARAARRSRTEKEFVVECLRLLELAASAQIQKKIFLDQLLRSGRHGEGPLGLIGRCYNGAPWVSADSSIYRISLAGYDEAGALIRDDTGQSIDATMRRLQARCAELSLELGLELRLAPATNFHCRSRLAELDLRYYPSQRGPDSGALGASDVFQYSDPMMGTSTARSVDEFIREGSSRGRHFGHGAIVLAPGWLQHASASEVAYTLQEAYRRSAIPGIRF